MSPLVVALTLVAAPAPPPVLPRSLPALSCRDIDPGFVHYVAPPEGRGPLWRIDRPPQTPQLDPHFLDFGPAIKAQGPQAAPRPPCARLTPAD